MNLGIEITELEGLLENGRAGTKAAAERERSLAAKQKRLTALPSIKRFIYSPTGDNRTRDALNHSEVIKLGAEFLTAKPLLQNLLISRFPILLIDESQDTNKLLMESLLSVQKGQGSRFVLGLFGDTMQRIYADGKIDLGRDIPPDWATPSKVMNHRCPHRVVKLINKIRNAVDDKEQQSRTDAKEGCVRLFIAIATSNKREIETRVRGIMAQKAIDPLWEQAGHVKTLILEHHMAARRLGFLEMFQPLYEIDSFRTGLLDGSLQCVRFFSECILPIVKAKQAGAEFSVMALARKWSPLLSENALKEAGTDQSTQLMAAKAGVIALTQLCVDKTNTSFEDVLGCVNEYGLFEIPDSLQPFASEESPEKTAPEKEDSDQTEEDTSASMEGIRRFLRTPFSQIEQYSNYVTGKAAFTTHQGVKGLEFPRVLVVMDDEEARGFSFSYEKLFGAKEKTKADTENEQAKRETGIDRTRRLFYVTCSRAKESLALIAYTSAPASVQEYMLTQGWFDKTEIEMLA